MIDCDRVAEQKQMQANQTMLIKVDLQQYITRIYGSLTTFNALFKSTNDYFVEIKVSK
jgi:predicted RNase H-like nuclease